MKASRYNYKFNFDEDRIMIYNTLSRKYVIYHNSKAFDIDNLFEELNKGDYTTTQIGYLKKLMAKGIVIKDDVDEIEIIEFKENAAKFQEQIYYIVIQPTLDCNFRCVYCFEEHKKVRMDDLTAEKLVKYIDSITKEVKTLYINWFGGEPLLEINRINELTKKFKEICKKNGCGYAATIVTNGYLLNEEIIENFEELSINMIQITLDGWGEAHNKKRPHENGQDTFEIVKENLVKLSHININRINMRINVDEENIERIHELFDIIPKENRRKVNVGICNLFQKKDKINVYELYKSAIDKGYMHNYNRNLYGICEVCKKNGFCIDPTGLVSACAVSSEAGYYLGYINDNGKLILKNEGFYYKLKNTTALKNIKCRKCIKLPICMGGCKYSRYKDSEICNGNVPDNLSIADKARLHYYTDLQQNKIKEADII